MMERWLKNFLQPRTKNVKKLQIIKKNIYQIKSKQTININNNNNNNNNNTYNIGKNSSIIFNWFQMVHTKPK